jgi:hypothetical protein
VAVDIDYQGTLNPGSVPIRRPDGSLDFVQGDAVVVSFTAAEMAAFKDGLLAGEFRP